MNRSIRRLAPETASRIAAGEVIERPLSALKEILENALDAGARSIEVRIERALDHRFEIADDGVGIAAEELELALERHATSKLDSLEDLDRLASLGFRGEALPSIAAVSRLSITSRTRGSESATYVAAEGGSVRERGAAARAPGTTVEVADLFFNTPARRKFLHSPAGELRAAIRMIECYALSYPGTGFRLTVDGRQRLDWPAALPALEGGGTNTAEARRERAAAVWGAAHARQLLAASGERDGYRVEALLGLPEHARASREGQIFLVNRRWIQNPMLGQALRQAYGNLLPGGRWPAAVLWLEVPAARLDVNVHPTKREVRFADESLVFSLVAGACAKPLSNLHPPFTVVHGGSPEPVWADRVGEKPVDQTYLGLDFPAAATPAQEAGTSAEAGAAAAPAPAPATTAEPDLWQLHRTYILAPVRGGVVIIDQHAAHERVLYEEALARIEGERGTSQQLLFPALIDLSRSQFDLFTELTPWLQQLGWNVTALGPPSVVVYGAPSNLGHEQPGRFLQDLLDEVGDRSSRDPTQEVSEHLARSHACHAAVRAGDALSPAEMRGLVDRLFATSRPHGDPHGRVTYVRMDLDELHKRFGRT